MKRRARDIEIFSLSSIDLFAAAMGAFALLTIVLMPFYQKEIQDELNKRKPGQSKITTQRKEKDQVQILSGIFENKTLGTPISLFIFNILFMSERSNLL